MKNKLGIIGVALLTIGSASAGITFGSIGALGLKDNLATNIPSGSLVLLLVDDGNDGFLNLGVGGAIGTFGTSALTSSLDPGVASLNASITAGQTFGGDLILATFSSAGGGSVTPALSNFSIGGHETKRFAVVWFQDTAANLASSRAGARYGIASGADWTLPTSDAGSYTFNATTNTTSSVYWQLAATTTAAQIGAAGFFTGSGTAGTNASKTAIFQVGEAIPEPSAALLGALGVLGLLRRRRI